MSKKVIGIAAVIALLIAIVVGVFMLKGRGTQEPEIDTSNMDNSNNEGNIIIDSERDEDAPIIPPDIDNSVKIEIEDIVIPNEYPELDWEEPPVLTYYNEEADTNNDGHVDKAEWEIWVQNHPEDLNQDMVIDDTEKEIYETTDENDDARVEFQPTVIPDTENPNTIIDPILAPSEEEQAAEDAKNRADNEAAGQGLAGLKQWGEQHKGTGNGFYSDLPEGAIVDENGNVGNAGLNVQ